MNQGGTSATIAAGLLARGRALGTRRASAVAASALALAVGALPGVRAAAVPGGVRLSGRKLVARWLGGRDFGLLDWLSAVRVRAAEGGR